MLEWYQVNSDVTGMILSCFRLLASAEYSLNAHASVDRLKCLLHELKRDGYYIAQKQLPVSTYAVNLAVWPSGMHAARERLQATKCQLEILAY